MQRTVWADADCPMARADDFQERLQISRHLLTTRLKKLVAGGVLARQPIEDGGKRQEYVLTPMGQDFYTTVVALRQWGDRWLFAPRPHPADMVDAVDGSVLAPLEVRSSKRRRVGPEDIRLKPTKKR